jgi:hypothetical protein
MKKWVLFVVLIGFLSVNCGDEEYTRLNAVFGEQPEGGSDVTELTCIVVGRLEGGSTPIQATLEGWWAEDIGQNEQLYGYDTWTFRTQDFEELRLIVQAPQGYVLMGYFWFRCDWTDEGGAYHEILSDTAYCYH